MCSVINDWLENCNYKVGSCILCRLHPCLFESLVSCSRHCCARIFPCPLIFFGHDDNDNKTTAILCFISSVRVIRNFFLLCLESKFSESSVGRQSIIRVGKKCLLRTPLIISLVFCSVIKTIIIISRMDGTKQLQSINYFNFSNSLHQKKKSDRKWSIQ